MAHMEQQHSISEKTILLHLLPSFIALGWLGTKASWFWSHQSDLEFGWVVALLCGFIFWESWQRKPAIQLRHSRVSASAGLLSVGLFFIFQIYQTAFGLKPASMVGLALAAMLMVFANLHVVFGWKGVACFLFAYAFILISLPMPSVVQGILVNGLQHQVAAFTVELLTLFGIPANLAGSVIHLSTGPVGVDDACSGIRSLQSSVMATLFIGFISLRSLLLRGLLFVMGVMLAILGNLVRVFFLSYQAHVHGVEAIELSHDAAGWSILIFTVAGVVLSSWLLTKVQIRLDRHAHQTRGLVS